LAVYLVGLCVVVFVSTYTGAVARLGGTRRTVRPPEPAYELYVLGQLLRDFAYAVSQAQRSASAVLDRIWHWVSGLDAWLLPIGVGAVVGSWCGAGLAALLTVLPAALVGAAAAVCWTLAWMGVLAMRAGEDMRRRVVGAHYECPTDHERFSLPTYLCPTCHAEHHRLVPGRWGIVRRRCACGKRLPTMILNGRQRIPQQCPNGHSMSGVVGLTGNVPIPIIGGTNVGKSTFLSAVIFKMLELESAGGISLEVTLESKSSWELMVRNFSRGVLPQHTTDKKNPAVAAEMRQNQRRRLLYIYDVAGEAYEGSQHVSELRFLDRAVGMVFLLDPFSLPSVRLDREQDLGAVWGMVRPSSELPENVLARIVAELRARGCNPAAIPLAVVVCKTDALGVGETIAGLASRTSREEAPRVWIEEHGGGNLVRAIRQSFPTVQWFACSALGRMPKPGDERPFRPLGTLEPLGWIFAQRGIPIRVTDQPAVTLPRHRQMARVGVALEEWRSQAAAGGLRALHAIRAWMPFMSP